jgi:hypothetical protein
VVELEERRYLLDTVANIAVPHKAAVVANKVRDQRVDALETQCEQGAAPEAPGGHAALTLIVVRNTGTAVD